MSALNYPENFAGRVNYAAQVISNRRNTSRAFDNCFENNDGEVVLAALARRAEKNDRLRENLPRYLVMDSVNEAHQKLAGKNLPDEARAMRERNRIAHEEWLRAHRAKQTA